jgi:hypothetical protein
MQLTRCAGNDAWALKTLAFLSSQSDQGEEGVKPFTNSLVDTLSVWQPPADDGVRARRRQVMEPSGAEQAKPNLSAEDAGNGDVINGLLCLRTESTGAVVLELVSL